MTVVVQKYGGSSLATPAHVHAVADRVAATRNRGDSVLVVVSARGDTTDQLLGLAGQFTDGTPDVRREVDQLLATGECASAALLAIALVGRGVPAVSLTGPQAGIQVRGRHGAGFIDSIGTGRIDALLTLGNVVVVAGFHGLDDQDDLVTLGRGGSDTTAVALAAVIGADRCEIYTDVDGVYTADPRLVPSARPMAAVACDVMAEMAFAGARVLHSRCVELAAARGVRVYVRNSFGNQLGTLIARRGDLPLLENDGAVVAVTHDPNVARVLVQARGRTDLAVEALAILARHAVPVDLIARSGPDEDEFRMGFTVGRDDIGAVRPALEQAVAAHGGSVHVDVRVAKVSLIGMGLLNRPEYVARMTVALAGAGIATSWVSTSQLRASVTVPSERAADAVALLHKEFDLDQADLDTELSISA
jgi:aspartate kinase